MPTLHLSPARLSNTTLIKDFKSLMLRHGATGVGDWNIPTFSERQKLDIVPLVFGLMPELAIKDRPYDLKIKPFIKAHFEELGLEQDNELIDIVKSISDQYFNTAPNRLHYFRRKFNVSDVRASKIFSKITERQNGRCGLCGVDFNKSNYETLDHIIPWRIIGDVPDGSNWQFLCADCNTGKNSVVSYLQLPESINWRYSNTLLDASSDVDLTRRLRYTVLCRDEKCQELGCANNALTSELFVTKISKTSLQLHDFYKTKCKMHLGTEITI